MSYRKAAGMCVFLSCLMAQPGSGQGFTGDTNDLTGGTKKIFNSDAGTNGGKVVVADTDGLVLTVDDGGSTTSDTTFKSSALQLEVNVNPGGDGKLILKRESASIADFLVIEGKDGPPNLFTTGGISYDTRKNAFIFRHGFSTVSPVVSHLNEVVTYAPSFANATTPVQLGGPMQVTAGFGKGAVVRCYASGRYNCPAGQTIEWSIRRSSVTGTKLGGNLNGGFQPDPAVAINNGYFCVNIEFTVRGDPTSGPVAVQGGGYIAMQKNNGDTRTAGADFANPSVTGLQSGGNYLLCAQFGTGTPGSITMSHCRWEVIAGETVNSAQ